jgi:hypothetical protein
MYPGVELIPAFSLVRGHKLVQHGDELLLHGVPKSIDSRTCNLRSVQKRVGIIGGHVTHVDGRSDVEVGLE